MDTEQIKTNDKKTILGLRTCKADMTSHGGFVWPESGRVECPDWNPEPVCGGGLHFLVWGEGDGSLLDWSETAKWLVVEVDSDVVVNIDNQKSKAPWCDVVFCGNRMGATDYIAKNGGYGRGIHGLTATAGDEGTATAGFKGTATAGFKGTATAGFKGTATAGDEGTATAGFKGTATAGDEGTATAGDEGTATAGRYGTATAGDEGTATAGFKGTATAGRYGTATAGDEGTATAGFKGTATAGRYGTATAGFKGTATAGDEGTATAGDEGTILIKQWDGKRWRIRIGYIGEDGLLPNVAYRLDDKGKFIEAEKE